MENAAGTALLLVLNQWCHVPNAEQKQAFRGGEHADEGKDSIRALWGSLYVTETGETY
jgi:hypothetical protein